MRRQHPAGDPWGSCSLPGSLQAGQFSLAPGLGILSCGEYSLGLSAQPVSTGEGCRRLKHWPNGILQSNLAHLAGQGICGGVSLCPGSAGAVVWSMHICCPVL